MPPASIALVDRVYREVYNEQDLAIATQIATSIFLHPQHFINQYVALRTAFPDWRMTRDLTLQDGNYVIVRWTGRGTHQGSYTLPHLSLTIPATGQLVTVLGISLYQVSGGKIVSRIGSGDSIEVLHQLGVRFVPPPAQHTTPRVQQP